MIKAVLNALRIRREAGSKTIAISMKPKRSPWGGGNQFVEQMLDHLQTRGHRVVFQLKADVAAILLIDPRLTETTVFSVGAIRAFKQAHPGVRCVHRINECDMRKGTADMDEMLRQANDVADVTVFISEWLRDYFVDRWFDPRRAHTVIPNGADPRIFHPVAGEVFSGQGRFRIVTHHWSDNWNKGFRVYTLVDEMVHRGELEDCSLTIIGRWPEEIRWASATTHPPARGKKLANLLRQNHVYLTASLWEPCGMHHIEGAQCGLPLVYHEDGGGIVEFGRRYGVGFRENVKEAIIEARRRYTELREKVLRLSPNGEQMCAEYEKVLLQ